MLNIKTDPKVLHALSTAFPKPPNAASRALSKYVSLLEQQINTALLNGRNPFQHKLDLYSVSLHELMNRGGQIGPKKLRVHKWLRDNDLALVEAVTKGSNLTGRLSEVKLTQLVFVSEPTLAVDNDLNFLTAEAGILEEFAKDIIDEHELLLRVCPEIENDITDAQLYELFDVVEVDTKSLNNYIYWLKNEAKQMAHPKKEHTLIQAKFILAVARALDGKYLQRKKVSDFGRIYYEGTSIQNINRTLRSAVLGNCWEYDITSSVVAWKMGFAKSYLREGGNEKTVDDFFKFTLWYITKKQDLFMNLHGDVFLDNSNVPKDLQKDLLKEAFTAITFGARASLNGWKDNTGHWKNPALVTIIKNNEERKRFLASLIVKRFIAEQNALDDFIFKKVIIHAPEHLKNKNLQTLGGKPAKAKLLAYLYQHAETEVMDIVRSVARHNSCELLANVHDAVFFRRRLSVNTKDKIIWSMRDSTKNPYWDLKEEEIQRFEKISKLHDADEERHRASIRIEEKHAADFLKAKKQVDDNF